MCNLLEVLLFHRTAVEETQDTLVELIDYCYRKLVWLSTEGKKLSVENDPKKILETKPVEVRVSSPEPTIYLDLGFLCAGSTAVDAADSVL